MTTLPVWIDDRIDPTLEKKLTQRHVVEVMLEAERPFFSVHQLQALVGPTVSEETVRNRLNELREIDVVAAETYPETLTLYYVNHPESQWPLSPEGKRALARDSALDTLSVGQFLRLRNPAGIRTLVLAGFQLSLVLFGAGIGLWVFGLDSPVEATSAMVEAAANLFLVCLVLLVAERAARELRAGDRGERSATVDRFAPK
ncbi:hypothetical protein [Natronolimnohabitans innermongolicus]|uniref:Uncharacterized protein n=1 Tax=Natronolimnohabitans innermongolicus JCM 12255 TaxID=1227499 RepID=L9WQI5_9EURY|nr:hypothetical protein [Natronolimnohabitans innermongolicus]ELY51652.1 hypothetical protein C493_17021 [Natronolimnohabitans innermongolicus JCM 12255]